MNKELYDISTQRKEEKKYVFRFFFFLMGQQKWKDKRQEGVPYFGAVMRETTIPRLRVDTS